MPKRETKKSTVATTPYKGVRDFYPEDMYIEEYLFETMRDVVEHFGYESYATSPLEPSELYEGKTSEEIVQEQTYAFTDRGDRRVTLRPEMTPSVARLVAARRRDLPLPLRWYSIANVFRYERPQRGRLREHYQLNCDLFGVSSIEGDVEVILLAYELMRAFGATENEFEIRINHRGVIPETLALLAQEHGFPFPEEKQSALLRLMDRRDKMKSDVYATEMQTLLGKELGEVILKHYTPQHIRTLIPKTTAGKVLFDILETLEQRGIPNIVHDPYLVRGFDYYTGTIFEVYDTNPDNKRSLFGGGRYDGLLDMFGVQPVPTVGFGMGDVTLRDFLETHNLLPNHLSPTDLYLGATSPAMFAFAAQLAQRLRRHDLTVAVDLMNKKVRDQIKTAEKKHIPFFLVVGEEELESGLFKLKHLPTGKEYIVPETQLADVLFETLE